MINVIKWWGHDKNSYKKSKEVCNFFSPFDHIQTSEVCNSPYKPYWKKLQTSRFVILHSNPIEKITNLEVCNFLITINRPAQTRNFHGPPECNGGPAGGTLARTGGFFYGRPEWARLVGLPSTTILSYVAIFAIAGAMEPWQHPFFRQRNTEWLRVTNPTQCDSHSLHLDRPRLRRPHAFFRCTRWLSTFHRGARPVFTRPS